MATCPSCAATVSDYAAFCHICGTRMSSQTGGAYYAVPAPADIVQQAWGLLSRLWFSLSPEERGAIILLIPSAAAGFADAIKRLREWLADRSRYDPRLYA